VASAPPEPADAGTDAAPDAAVAIVDAGAPDFGAMCRQMCSRAIECALKITDGMRGQMADAESKCLERCAKETTTSSKARIARAQACLKENDCSAFMSCMQDVMDKKD
jgi:hypothetical protein